MKTHEVYCPRDSMASALELLRYLADRLRPDVVQTFSIRKIEPPAPVDRFVSEEVGR